MKQGLGQQLRLGQQQVMLPQLQQAIKMLVLTRQEMTELIEQELLDNPLLEEIQESQEDGSENSSENSNEEADASADGEFDGDGETKDFTEANESNELKDATESSAEEDWSRIEDYLSHSEREEELRTTTNTREHSDEEDHLSLEQRLTRTEDLAQHLLSQLNQGDFSRAESQWLEQVIYNLNQDGHLEAEALELLKELQVSLGLTVPRTEELLTVIQRLNPTGCATTGPRASLKVQAEQLEGAPFQMAAVIEHHLEDLYRKRYREIAQRLKTTVEVIKACEAKLVQLNPRPGLEFSGQSPQYVVPDIYVRQHGDQFVVEMNQEGIPELRISKKYRQLLKGVNDKTSKDFLSSKLKGAFWMLKAIGHRQRTIFQVAKTIVARQQDFFHFGVECLKPMVLKDVADEIGVHESTVSRVTTNKFMLTPKGTFELKYFFNGAVGQGAGMGGPGMAQVGELGHTADQIKLRIKTLISQENRQQPLSDEAIVALLKSQGMEVARRTVAKYRDELGFLPSSKRRL